jgi:hypothetical protein
LRVSENPNEDAAIDYARPASLDEAIRLLAENEGAKVSAALSEFLLPAMVWPQSTAAE